MAQVTLTNKSDFDGEYGTAAAPVTFSSNEVVTNIVRGLTATKTANKEYWVDGPLVYQIKVQNNSGDTFQKGVLTDTLDTSLVAFNAAFGVQINGTASTDFTYGDGVLKVNLPDLEDGGEVTVTFQVTQTNA